MQKPGFHYVALVLVDDIAVYGRLTETFKGLFGDEMAEITYTPSQWKGDMWVATFKVSSTQVIAPRLMREFDDEVWESEDAAMIISQANCSKFEPVTVTSDVYTVTQMLPVPTYMYTVAGLADFGFWDLFNTRAERAVLMTKLECETLIRTYTDMEPSPIVGQGVNRNGSSVVTVYVESKEPLPSDLIDGMFEIFKKNKMKVLGEVLS